MNIDFIPLSEYHFPLLLKWLQAPHVKAWWDQGISYSQESVHKKYTTYAKGYKLSRGISKPIQAYIIHFGNIPIGYIQTYNAYDFPRSPAIFDLPESLGAIDIFIGEEEYIQKGIGAIAIKTFIEKYVLTNYKYVFGDPEYNNEIAVRAYEKAGFVIIKRIDKVFCMVSHKQIIRLSIKDSIALEVSFRKSFLKQDRLWLFGSRTKLEGKGGDIDLYIETNAETVNEAANMKSKLWIALTDCIGEQKIDIVLNVLKSAYHIPIYDAAKAGGVRIV